MEKLFSKMTEILAPQNQIVYEIPEFQREYAWGKEQCNALFDDIDANEKGYFLGSIICISGRAINQNAVIKYQVIDGQQRLTTVSLLLLSIIKKLNPIEIENRYGRRSTQSKLYDKTLEMLCYEDSDNICRERIAHQEGNRDDYIYLLNSILKPIMENQGLKVIVPNKPDHFGNRRISWVYEHFCKRLNKFTEEELLTLLNKVIETAVVSINVEDETKAFLLFEALNNRGLDLSVIDLLKNNLIKVSSALKIKEECNQSWMKMKSYIGDEAALQERFLRHYYNALVRKNGVDNKSTKAKRSNLLDLYKKEIAINCKGLVDDLLEAAKLYARISTNEIEPTDALYSNLSDLAHAEGATSYSLLLYLMKNNNTFKLTDEQFAHIIDVLVNFFLIRTLTDKPATRDLDNIFMDIIDNIEIDGSNIEDTIINTLKARQDISVDDLQKELNKDVYTEYQSATRFFLSYFETNSTGQKGNDYNKYWNRDNKGRLIWTIEHVLPETKGDLPDKWNNMLAKGDKIEAKKIQQECMHKLGNLTLTPYNSELSNAALSEKQVAPKEKGGYQSTNLFLNGNMGSDKVTAIKTATVWTASEINARSDFLIGKFINKIYPIDNENDIYKNN